MRYNDTKAHVPVGNHFKERVIDLSNAYGCEWGEGNDKVFLEEQRIAEELNAKIPAPKQEDIAQHGMYQSGVTQAAAMAKFEDMHVQMYAEQMSEQQQGGEVTGPGVQLG